MKHRDIQQGLRHTSHILTLLTDIDDIAVVLAITLRGLKLALEDLHEDVSLETLPYIDGREEPWSYWTK